MPAGYSELQVRQTRMHTDELDISAGLVRTLLAGQFPQWSALPISVVQSVGTVNAIFRLGDDLCVRLPRNPRWADDLDNECDWLPRLAPRLSLTVPEPVARGKPTDLFPLSWAIYRWIDGQPYADDLIDDEHRAAQDLAAFVTELRAVEPIAGSPPAGRMPLCELDAETRGAIEAARGLIDADAAAAAWDLALKVPAFDGMTPVWIHTDLLRPNLLVGGGRISAVIDFGGLGMGDPAADVIAAWAVFGPAGRAVYRSALDIDDDTWRRARGYALHQAAVIIPYYATTNPQFAIMAKRTVEQVLLDHS